MKRNQLKILVVLAVMGLGMNVATAQTEWKGPKAKNRKLWKDPLPMTTIYTKTGNVLKGAEAKNTRPLDRKDGELVAVAFTQRDLLKGPAAKNKKLWRN